MTTTDVNVARLYEDQFTIWQNWHTRDELTGVKYPGIYVIAYSSENLTKTAFSWREEIKYVGMTNSLSGLQGRLKQFDNTIRGKAGHGGADRFLYKYPIYNELAEKLYVAVRVFPCSPQKSTSKDLLIMGDVAKFEYQCFAHFQDTFGSLPEFNNKKALAKV